MLSMVRTLRVLGVVENVRCLLLEPKDGSHEGIGREPWGPDMVLTTMLRWNVWCERELQMVLRRTEGFEDAEVVLMWVQV